MAFDPAAARTPLWPGLETSLAHVERRSEANIKQESSRNPNVHTTESHLLRNWFKVRNDFVHNLTTHLMRKHAEANPGTHERLGDVVCEFYNVLWIERRDGIAYRRACGWVPKCIWEAHATGPAEVKLG